MVEFPSKNKDNSEEATGLLFMRTYNKWHGEIKKQLRCIGITHPQFVILTSLGYSLQYEAEVTQIMLARMAGMDVASVSQIINLLEKHGWIFRKVHTKDTRAKSVTLTAEGQNKLKQALPVVETIDVQFFGSLGENEKIFLKLLQSLNEYEAKE